MLSAKAQNLLQVITARGGGYFDEYWLRDKTGLSHGSIVAARQELVAEGLLSITKESRKLIYTLTSQQGESGQQEEKGQGKAGDNPSGEVPLAPPTNNRPAPSATAPPPAAKTLPAAHDSFLPAMPHVAGNFYDFDEWTDALMNALGSCVDISESLLEEGTYTVYSHEYEGEDTYHTWQTEDGFVVE
ncbi:hypothetical protein SAMN02910356_01585 [Selenomonas sp. GACV-9]|uniref:hypothetical protein n=1 Tax=unclassified Selenomonas TaxID=2637378 RepID=UPI0008824194|nr:hypothetical protein SAMN05216584_102223 [Selenomonas ruminantium]SFT67276.1 hypothetical protein SAMN02910356_01585 [Selenomonas ruminantium]